MYVSPEATTIFRPLVLSRQTIYVLLSKYPFNNCFIIPMQSLDVHMGFVIEMFYIVTLYDCSGKRSAWPVSDYGPRTRYAN
jgi:hypothetical protein